jgi:hypothetical protein
MTHSYVYDRLTNITATYGLSLVLCGTIAYVGYNGIKCIKKSNMSPIAKETSVYTLCAFLGYSWVLGYIGIESVSRRLEPVCSGSNKIINI